MDIEVGDFVRINNDFRLVALGIGKVVNINKETIYIKKTNIDLPISINKENIVKHSKNIIDLIEVGDLLFINDFAYYNFIHIYDETMLEALKEDVRNGVKIKQILTHEQYMQNCYTVERG